MALARRRPGRRGRPSRGVLVTGADDVVILGAGMHPWGKWGRDFVRYGVHAARAASDRGRRRSDRRRVRLGCRHDAQRLPGLRLRRDVRPGARLDRHPRRVELRGVRIRCDRASTSPVTASSPAGARWRSWSAPTPRRRASSRRTRASVRTIPTGCGSACSVPPTRPTSRFHARRRMDLYGATERDFAEVKVKNARHGLANPNARYRKETSVDEVLASPIVSDPLRLLQICATSDGGAAAGAGVDASGPSATARTRPVRDRGGLDRHADLPDPDHRAAGLRHRQRRRRASAGPRLQGGDRRRGVRRGRHRPGGHRGRRGLRPVDRARARLVRAARLLRRRARPRSCCATASRPSAAAPGQPERRARLLRRGRPRAGHRAGLRAHLAAARPGDRPPGRDRRAPPRVGITANQGLFGHGSSVIVTRDT